MSTSPFDAGAGGEGDRVDQHLSTDDSEADSPPIPGSDDVPADEADRIDQATAVGDGDDDYPRDQDDG